MCSAKYSMEEGQHKYWGTTSDYYSWVDLHTALRVVILERTLHSAGVVRWGWVLGYTTSHDQFIQR
jgi:hypothetical protein